MLPDRVSNPGPLTYESGALPIALRGPAGLLVIYVKPCDESDFAAMCMHIMGSRFSDDPLGGLTTLNQH